MEDKAEKELVITKSHLSHADASAIKTLSEGMHKNGADHYGWVRSEISDILERAKGTEYIEVPVQEKAEGN